MIGLLVARLSGTSSVDGLSLNPTCDPQGNITNALFPAIMFVSGGEVAAPRDAPLQLPAFRTTGGLRMSGARRQRELP